MDVLVLMFSYMHKCKINNGGNYVPKELDRSYDVTVFRDWPDSSILYIRFFQCDLVIASDCRPTRLDLVYHHKSVDECKEISYTAQFRFVDVDYIAM